MNEFIFVRTTAEQILSHPTWDIVVIFAFIAIGFFYGISAGKWRIAATIIYTYAALAIFSALPIHEWTQKFSVAEEFMIKIGLFLLLLLFFIFMLGSRRKSSIAFSTSWWQVFILSFLQVGLVIHILVSFLPPEKLRLLAPVTRTIFANPELHLWWLIVPMAILVLLRRLSARED